MAGVRRTLGWCDAHAPEASRMSLDLLSTPRTTKPWAHPASYWGAMTAALAEVSGPSPPSTPRPSATTPSTSSCAPAASRSASRASPCACAKSSTRCSLYRATASLLAFTLPEALWLAETADDIVLGYPTVDRAAIAALAADDRRIATT